MPSAAPSSSPCQWLSCSCPSPGNTFVHSPSRAEQARGKGEDVRLLCERRASHSAASSRGAGGAAAGCPGRSSHAPAQYSTQPAVSPACWGSSARGAQQWRHTHSCPTHLSAGRRHLWHPPSCWQRSPAVQLPSRALHGAGACGSSRAHQGMQSMGHRAWLEAQLRMGRSYSSASYYAAVPAAAASAAASARQAWNSYARAAYTPKLPGWFRSRLPEMPESAPLDSQLTKDRQTLRACSQHGPCCATCLLCWMCLNLSHARPSFLWVQPRLWVRCARAVPMLHARFPSTLSLPSLPAHGVPNPESHTPQTLRFPHAQAGGRSRACGCRGTGRCAPATARAWPSSTRSTRPARTCNASRRSWSPRSRATTGVGCCRGCALCFVELLRAPFDMTGVVRQRSSSCHVGISFCSLTRSCVLDGWAYINCLIGIWRRTLGHSEAVVQHR